PLAAAVVAEAQLRGTAQADVSDFDVVAGQGVLGVVAGKSYSVGRPEWAEEQGFEFPPALRRALEQRETRGESVITLMDDERVLAIVSLADRVRQSARDAVSSLAAAGVESVMITGDAEGVAKTVADELGIERYFARVLPREK